MIIQPHDSTFFTVYQCGICKQIFLSTGHKLQCLVLHSPGSCCHFNEMNISQELAQQAIDILQNNSKFDPNCKQPKWIGDRPPIGPTDPSQKTHL